MILRGQNVSFIQNIKKKSMTALAPEVLSVSGRV